MRDLIVDELTVGAPPDKVAKAKRLVESAGNIAAQLVGVGFAPRDVLQACCAVTGVPPAPQGWLRDPKPPAIEGLDGDLCRRLGAAPVATQNGKICIAYTDPEIALRSDDLGFPKHQAYLALEKDLEKALSLLPSGEVDDESSLFDDEVPPDDDDGRTIVNAQINFDEHGNNTSSASESAEAEADDDILFDDPTRALMSPPSAPKPAPRQQSAVVSRDSHDTLVNAPTKVGPMPSPPPDRASSSSAVSSSGSSSSTSGGPPSTGSTRKPAGPAMADLQPKETVKTPAPKDKNEHSGLRAAIAASSDGQSTLVTPAPNPSSLKNAKDHPAANIPSNVSATGATKKQPAATPGISPAAKTAQSPSGVPSASSTAPHTRAASTQSASDKAASPPQRASSSSSSSSSSSKRAPVASADDRATGVTNETQAKVLAELSEDDLLLSEDGAALDDDDLANAAQKTIAQAPSTGNGTRAVSPARSELPAKSEPPAPPQKSDARAPKAAAKAARASSSSEGRPASSSSEGRTGVNGGAGIAIGQASDEQTFASSDSAPDQEAVQNQKQRLKRIAQIASIKRYKIDRVLGRGGMATVYHAIDTKTGSSCALKLMEPHLADDAVFVERFKREIRACTALNHENIVRVFDYGEENGTYYMASEFVDGGTVASLLKLLDRPLPIAIVVPLMVGFLDGLQHAHEQGFVHRDLKPANLMLTKSGIVKIGDFGIAKAQTDSTLTKTGALFGTPAYMSPEQAQGQELDTRSDLFGVGIIFYELLAGYNPYAHENPSTTMFAIAKGNARALFDANPTVPEAVERVVQKLLEKDLKKRYQSASQARDELQVIHAMVVEKFPDGVSRSLGDPEHVVDELAKAQSTLESDRATKLLGRNPPEHAEAAFRYYKATLLDAQNYDAVNGLTQLRADYGFRFTRPDDKQIVELEQSLEKKPDQPAVLRRLADISATHRNLVDMAGFMKRYLRFFPNDTHVAHKLERIVGNDPLAPFSLLKAETPDDSTSAWQASDDMMDAASAAADEVAPALTPGRGSAVRPAAKLGAGAPPSPQGKGAAPSPTTDPKRAVKQTTGSGPAHQQSSKNAAGAKTPSGKTPESGSTPAVPSEGVDAVDATPARDSLELVFRLARGFAEDVVRSFTGDQGLEGFKDAVKERLGSGGGDLKDVAKAALGKGRDVVADSLLKQEGRKQLMITGRGFAQKHWRLGAVIVGFFVMMGLLGKACSLVCGSAPAPVPQKKIVAPDITDDGLSPKKSDKKKNDKKADDKKKDDDKPVDTSAATKSDATPKADATPKMSAEEEERLLGVKTAPVVVPDAKKQLADKQDDLKRRAKAEADPKKAIELYTQAIDTDPYAPGARDALLGRAKLYQTQNNLEAAQADLFRLKRRPDVGEIQSDVDAMLADIAKAMQKQAPPEAPANP